MQPASSGPRNGLDRALSHAPERPCRSLGRASHAARAALLKISTVSEGEIRLMNVDFRALELMRSKYRAELLRHKKKPLRVAFRAELLLP